MKKNRYIHGVLCVSVTALLFFLQTGCTGSDEEQVGEKGRIEQMTDEVAEEAVRKIRTPINKAHGTKDLGDERMESMDKALQEQQ